jgi:hypothetical protein
MKLQNIKDVDAFFRTIDMCCGRVELITAEGDRLNLKSKLTQYISLANVFSNEASIPELELTCSEPGDIAILMDFLEQEN